VRTDRPLVYVAGPGGFDAAGRRWHRHVCEQLTSAGFGVSDPWAASADAFEAAGRLPPGDARHEALIEANRSAGRKNASLIRSAAAVLALLDGVDVDSGTAAEIGYAAALGIRIVGYRTDWRTTGDNEAAPVNLQVASFIEASGGPLLLGGPDVDDDALLAAAIAALRSG
jgi:nucleoside 2-deoxyribosyltransferase